MGAPRMRFVTNITADTAAAGTGKVRLPEPPWCVQFIGNFGGGTITVELGNDDGGGTTVFGTITNGEFTADDAFVGNISAEWIRFQMASATSPDVDVFVSSNN